MATDQNRESFIPYSRQELIDICLEDSNFSEEKNKDLEIFLGF